MRVFPAALWVMTLVGSLVRGGVGATMLQVGCNNLLLSAAFGTLVLSYTEHFV